jgi:hypothetical protein
VLPSGEELPTALKTAILAQYDKNVKQIYTAVIAATTNVTVNEVDNDGYIETQKPIVSANDARSAIFQALASTKSYLRPKTNTTELDIIQPDNHASVYTFDTGLYFFSNAEERAAVTPNTIIYCGIDSGGTLLYTDTAGGHGVNAASVALLDTINEYNDADPLNRENSTTQAHVDDKADVRIAKLVLSTATGTLVAPMHCSLELFDAVTIVDDRYTPSKTITGYVFRIQREFRAGKGIYQITVTLGGIETGYTPAGAPGINVTRPVIPQTLPVVDTSYLLPAAIQGYSTDIVFSATDENTVAWSSGTIKFYDGTTQAITAGNTGDLSTTGIYYIYFDLDDASPGVLKVILVDTYVASIMDTKTGVLCVCQKTATTGAKANFIPSYGKQPLLTPDWIDMSGIKEYDYGSGAKLQAILSTQISAGLLKLTAATVKDGEWYSESGVDINAATGINIYGTANAFTTRATKTGTIQCYVGSDGKIYAGAGNVSLDEDGIKLVGQGRLKYYEGATLIATIDCVDDTLYIISESDKDIAIVSGNKILLNGKTVIQTSIQLPVYTE